MTAIAETITTKLDTACGMVVAYRERIVQAATTGEGSSDLGTFVVRLAEAEGSRDMWSRLSQHASYLSRQGEELTMPAAMTAAFNVLTNGADDTWSGRTNDVKRSYFDGMREAASQIEWVF